jgi:hypothetical protein
MSDAEDLHERILALQARARVLRESRDRLRAQNVKLLAEMNAMELELVAVKHDMERLRRGELQ